MDKLIRLKANSHGTGRPIIADDQYAIWLEDMRPFLKAGFSLHSAIIKAGLYKHKTAIYEKSRSDEEFAEKITYFQTYIGELVQIIIFQSIQRIYNEMISSKDYRLTNVDAKLITFVAENHRASVPFFFTKLERYSPKKREINLARIGKVLDQIEAEGCYPLAKI